MNQLLSYMIIVGKGSQTAGKAAISLVDFLNPAVDFRKWLRFPRGAAGASSASPVGSPPSAISLRSLRLLLQSPARNQ
jgi:hypothetical protein